MCFNLLSLHELEQTGASLYGSDCGNTKTQVKIFVASNIKHHLHQNRSEKHINLVGNILKCLLRHHNVNKTKRIR